MRNVAPYIAYLFFLAMFLFLFFFYSSIRQSRKIRQIARLESKMDKVPLADTVTSNALINEYRAYARRYSDDSLAPEYLYRAGNVYLNINKTRQGIEMFRKVSDAYPSTEKNTYALFMLAFIYENYMLDLSSANNYYHQFIRRYPKHQLISDIENAIYYLGLTPSEIVDQFRQEATGDTTTVQLQPAEL